MRFVAIVILGLVLLFDSLFAQELIVLEEFKVIDQQIEYNLQQSANSVPNYILNELSLKNKIPVTLLKIGVLNYLKIQIVKNSSISYQVKTRLDSVVYLQDINYKGFSVNSLLKPDSVIILLRLNDKNSTKKYEFSFLVMPSLKPLENVWQMEDSSKRASFVLSDIKIFNYHSEGNKKVFDNFKFQIEAYPLASEQLAVIEKEIAAVDVKNMAMVPLYFIDVKDAKKKLQNLKPDEKFGLLSLNIKDSLNFLLRYNAAFNQCERLYKELNQLNQALDYEYYNQAYIFEKQGNIAQALKFYNKSIALNPAYTPAIYRIAFIQFGFDSLAASAENLHKVLSHYNADFTTRQSALALSDQVLSAMVNRGLDFNQKQLFNESIDILTKALEFCSNTNEITCSPLFYQVYSAAKYGLFDSYLTITRKAIQKQKLDIAFDYLQIAEEYQKDNAQEIISAIEIDKIKGELALISIRKAEIKLTKNYCSQCIEDIERARVLINNQATLDTVLMQRVNDANAKAVRCVYSKIVQKANQKIIQKSIYEAQVLINQALKYQSENHQIILENIGTDTLIKIIKNIEYQDYIDKGNQDLLQQKCAAAYALFLQAKACELDIQVQKNDSLNAFIKSCLNTVLLEKTKDAQLKAWGSKYNEADSLQSFIVSEIHKYSFLPDSNLRVEMENLKALIENDITTKKRNEFRRLIQLGIANADLYDYLAAEKSWKSALSLAQNSTSIILDSNQVNQLLLNYSAEIVFAHQLSDFNALLVKQDWWSSIELYKRLQVEYLQNAKLIGKFRIPQLTQICDENKTHLQLLLQSINYFDSLKQYDKAFYIAEMFPPNIILQSPDKEMLLKFAQNAALYDIATNPKSSKKNLYLLRFKNKNNPKLIKKAYLISLLKA